MIQKEDNVKSVEYFKKLITKVPKNEEIRLRRCCEWIVLRPNDEKYWHGEVEFNNKVQAVEELLDTDKYKHSELRKYYYDMKDNEHSFHDFARWKVFGRKAG